jgi:CheY-like chemotaxis protein
MSNATKRILCVDDDPATLKVRQILLDSAGYSVITSTSGEEALKLVDQGEEVDLVLLDYMMPGMKGDELAAILRQRHPGLRLVAVSAVGQLPVAFINNVDTHLHKGQEPEAFLSAVSSVLESSRAEHVVLCVEDEPLQMQLRKMQLESGGFQVVQATSANTALEIFRAQPVDAVVMDYWLSCGRNGTGVAEEMKKLHPNTPIVMLSGLSALPGEGAIVDAWLRKSHIESEDLVNEVTRLIGFRSDKPKSAAS